MGGGGGGGVNSQKRQRPPCFDHKDRVPTTKCSGTNV